MRSSKSPRQRHKSADLGYKHSYTAVDSFNNFMRTIARSVQVPGL